MGGLAWRLGAHLRRTQLDIVEEAIDDRDLVTRDAQGITYETRHHSGVDIESA